jgi:hypothetical protein
MVSAERSRSLRQLRRLFSSMCPCKKQASLPEKTEQDACARASALPVRLSLAGAMLLLRSMGNFYTVCRLRRVFFTHAEHFPKRPARQSQPQAKAKSVAHQQPLFIWQIKYPDATKCHGTFFLS